MSELNQAVQRQELKSFDDGVYNAVSESAAGMYDYEPYGVSTTFSVLDGVWDVFSTLLLLYIFYAVVRALLLGKAQGWSAAHTGFTGDVGHVLRAGKSVVTGIGRGIRAVVGTLWNRAWIRYPLIVVVVFFLLDGMVNLVDVVRVQPGQVLVDMRSGKTRGMGYHLSFPLVTRDVLAHVANYDFDIQNITADSSEPQDVNLHINIVFRLEEQKLRDFYNREGVLSIWDVANSVVTPRAIEAIKKVVNQYSFKDILLEQTAVKDQSMAEIRAKLEPLGVVLTDLNIVNIMVPRPYVAKIEERELVSESTEIAKRKLEEEKTKTETELEIAERNRKTREIEAAGFRAAGSMMGDMLELKRLEIDEARLENEKLAIDKWNGALPTNVGDGFMLMPGTMAQPQ